MTTHTLPPVPLRDAVARAVHETVCDATDSDGAFRCGWYAFAGYLALRKATGRSYIPQVGGADVVHQTGPPARSVYICGEDDGFSRGEYHAWLALPDPEAPEDGGQKRALEYVDFSARHYPRLLHMPNADDVSPLGDGAFLVRTVREPEPWTAPPPPDYVWAAGHECPPGVSFYPDLNSCLSFVDAIKEEHETADRVASLVGRYLARELDLLRRSGRLSEAASHA